MEDNEFRWELKQENSSPRIPRTRIVQKSKFLDKEKYLKWVSRHFFTIICPFSVIECLPKDESRLKIQPATRVIGSVLIEKQPFALVVD
jgi:hypothetical protein